MYIYIYIVNTMWEEEEGVKVVYKNIHLNV